MTQSGETQALVFKIKHDEKPISDKHWRRYVKLAGNKKLSDIPGEINFCIQKQLQNQLEEHVCGSISYIEAGYDLDHFLIAIQLPLAQFERLYNLAEKNRTPLYIVLNIPELSYGDSPDGDDKYWDQNNKPSMAVAGFSFVVDFEDALAKAEQQNLEDQPIDSSQTNRYTESFEAGMPWYDKVAIRLQRMTKDSEAGKLGQTAYSDQRIRMSIVHTREDMVLMVAYLSALNTQLQGLKRLIAFLVVLIALMLINDLVN